MSTRDAHAEIPSSQRTAAGEGLRLSLACPGCGIIGWISWSQLKRGMRCPKCRCQFLIAPDGRLAAHADLPQVHFACPRCGKSGSLPKVIAVRGVECVACRLPLAPGPDRQLHGVDEADQMRRELQGRAGASRLGAFFVNHEGRLRKLMVGAAILMFIGLLGGAVLAVQPLFDHSPEKRAQEFTQECLAGQWKSALKYVPDDPVQASEFQRWRSRHFNSIIASHRPPRDSVRLSVTVVRQSATERLFRISMKSRFLGTRDITQKWRLSSGDWVFDAVATLSETDDQPARKRPRDPAEITLPRQRPVIGI